MSETPLRPPGQTALYIRIARAIYPKIAFTFRHPLLNILVGLGLLVIGIDEFIESVVSEYESFFQVHHAVIIIGLMALTDGFISLVERTEAALEEAHRRKTRTTLYGNDPQPIDDSQGNADG
jgi:hypothetical protein